LNNKLKIFAPPILWALLIAILCGLPGRDIPHISFLELLSFDKLVHAFIFFVLVLLIQLAVKKTPNKKNAILYALCFSIPYGAMLEIMQQEFFTERTADIFDFLANTLGCCLAWAYLSGKNKLITKKLIYKDLKNKS
jgi:glycopeptide antibiotics resistance protein